MMVWSFAWVILLAGCVREEKDAGAESAQEAAASATTTASKADADCPSCCTPLSRGAMLRQSAGGDAEKRAADAESAADIDPE